MKSIPKLFFKKTTSVDWPILLELEKSEIGNNIYNPFTNLSDVIKYFSKSIVYKVFIADKLVGYCAYELKVLEAEITALLVLKPYRKRGIGEFMLKKMLVDLNKIKKIRVSTSPENIIPLNLYLRYGFVIKERKENYWQNQARIILYRLT